MYRPSQYKGGLASYLSMLDDSFEYVPQDVIVPGILEAGDVADVASVFAPHPLLMQGIGGWPGPAGSLE